MSESAFVTRLGLKGKGHVDVDVGNDNDDSKGNNDYNDDDM